jgi:hypothetical protein
MISRGSVVSNVKSVDTRVSRLERRSMMSLSRDFLNRLLKASISVFAPKPSQYHNNEHGSTLLLLTQCLHVFERIKIGSDMSRLPNQCVNSFEVFHEQSYGHSKVFPSEFDTTAMQSCLLCKCQFLDNPSSIF